MPKWDNMQRSPQLVVDFADLNGFENWFNDMWSVEVNNYLDSSADFTGNVGSIASNHLRK
jgi:hypothetical protein